VYFIPRYLLKEIIARRVFNAEPLGTMDEFFMYDSAVNKANILTVMHLDKFSGSPADFGNFILDTVRSKKGDGFPRMQHKLKKFLGEFYFVKMDDAEY
jgi:hypothetical protein